MSTSQNLSQLASGSLQIHARQRPVRLNQDEQVTQRLYLELEGTPAAFRFLAELLQAMANHADASDDPLRGHSVIIDPRDTDQLAMAPWSALSLGCRRQL
ncbi:MAG: hypothetical protein ACR2NP_08695 [Pirellulaceae bacterium]